MTAIEIEENSAAIPSIEISPAPDGRGSQLQASQFIPRPRDEVFHFFGDATRLEEMTPPWLNFRIITPLPIQIRAGSLIDYRLRLHGIPFRWRTRIAIWEPPFRFVDEQLVGPYHRWHHEHIFEAVEGGTLCRDIVEFKVPGGSLVERMFVRSDLLRIFQFRQAKLRELLEGNCSDDTFRTQ